MKRLLLGPHAVKEALQAGADRVSVVYAEAEPNTAVNDVLLGLAYLVRAYFGKNEQSDRTNLNIV